MENATLLLCGTLAAYLRPPQVNGAEHYDVEERGKRIGRLTRRTRGERPTPGWFVWLDVPQAGVSFILRHNDEIVYHATPEDALHAMCDAIRGRSSTDRKANHNFEPGQEVEVLDQDGKFKYNGMFAGKGETAGSYSIYNRDTLEFSDVPQEFVR